MHDTTEPFGASKSIVGYDREATIVEVFSAQVALTPDAVAIRSDTALLSFAEVDARSRRLSNYLRSRGVAARDRVGVAFERSIELPIVLLAILRAGAAYVPLDTSYPARRFSYMIADAALSSVVTDGPICDPALYDGLSVISVVDDACAITTQSTDVPRANIRGDDLAYIMYTSGSTGDPKGVAIPQRGVVRLVRDVDYVDIRSDDTFMHFAPLAFDASTFELWAPLLNGAKLAIPGPGLVSIPELGALIERFGVTTMFLTTSLFRRAAESGSPGFSKLRHMLTGGEVASPSHMRRFLEAYPRCRLSAVYGPTENTTFSTFCDLASAASIGEKVPIGGPIAHSTAHVMDGNMHRVPDGVEGELCVGGDGVARGYVNQESLSNERFVLDPFSAVPGARLYRTGDRARIRPDGHLEFLGRNDDQVKIGGHRIELGEIEVALRSHPSLPDAAVAVAELGGEKALFAFVRPRPGSTLSEADVRTFLAGRLPRFMLPHRISLCDHLPEHPSGKLDRRELGRMANSLGSTSSDVSVAPREGPPTTQRRVVIRRAISDLWLELVGGDEEPDADTNFFDAGGDSLRLLLLHERLQRACDVDVPLVALFEHSTIRKMTALVSSLTA